jgi:hypothetical protein
MSDLKHCFQQQVLIHINDSPDSVGERLITSRRESKDVMTFMSQPDPLQQQDSKSKYACKKYYTGKTSPK